MKIELELPKEPVADTSKIVDHRKTKRAKKSKGSQASMLLQMVCLLAAIGPFLCLMVSCGGSQDKTASEPEQHAIPTGSELTIFTWAEYIDPEVLKKFEESTGFKVNYEVCDSLDEMEAKLISEPGKFDVVITEAPFVQRMVALRQLAELDHSKLPNFINIDRRFANMPFDLRNKYSVPYLWGSTLIAYRKDKVGDLKPSWSSLIEADAKGKVALFENTDPFYSMMFHLGIDPAIATVRGVERAEEVITGMFTNGAKFCDDFVIREGLKTGELWIAMAYSSDAIMIAEENENISYMIPEEGTGLWVDNFAITRDTKNSDLAHLFLDFLLQGKIAAANANFARCASPNSAAAPDIDTELLANLAINPPSIVLDRCRLLGDPSSELKVALSLAWKRIIQAIPREEAY